MKFIPSRLILSALALHRVSAFLAVPRSALVQVGTPKKIIPKETIFTQKSTQHLIRLSAAPTTETKTKFALDIPLLLYFFFWYLGNYYYNITNKLALNAAGGAAGFPITISTLQLLVGAIYATFLWVAPDSRRFPSVTLQDIIKLLPVAVCAAGAHASSVFALSAGAVSFGQIVKAAEPAFAAVLGTLFYNKKISKAKWLCLIPVIGGVVLASVKELDFAVSALISASIANLFAAIKANENKKCMDTPGLKERIGSVGNQYALTTILATLISIPLIFVKGEAAKFGEFVSLFNNSPVVKFNILASGLYFYLYNELATLTIKKTSAVTQSVANTAKRVIVIVGVAIVLGEALPPLKLLGCAIGIGGVFLYSLADIIWPANKNTKNAETSIASSSSPVLEETASQETSRLKKFLKILLPLSLPIGMAFTFTRLTKASFAVAALLSFLITTLSQTLPSFFRRGRK